LRYVSRSMAGGCLALLALSQCSTDACGCTPAFSPAVVVGRVLGGFGTPVAEAPVRAYSAPGAGCHSADNDFGTITTGVDGTFELGLSIAHERDSVCVYLFARPPAGSGGLDNSDTALVVMDFRPADVQDSAEVELVLRQKP
jgi:hypothetical protein